MILHVLGARPNFVKAFSILREMSIRKIPFSIVHTGQHYDYSMSKSFFEDLLLPYPNFFFNVGSGTHAVQTSKVMIETEKLLMEKEFKCVVIYGDVNSSLGASLSCAKCNIPIVHIESGCRSFDKTMPEEINRIMIDHISNYLFCIDNCSEKNLYNENICNNVFVCGNPMVDALHYILPACMNNKLEIEGIDSIYGILTLHRPVNVDNMDILYGILHSVNRLGRRVVFPAHPRCSSKIDGVKFPNIKIVSPMSYRNFVSLLCKSEFIITDSGGIQSESSVLNIPCYTLRNSTEHVSTIEYGTNTLCSRVDEINIDNKKTIKGELPWIWDGNAGSRIVNEMEKNGLC